MSQALQIAAAVFIPSLVAVTFYALGVRHRLQHEAKRAEIIAALEAQRAALDHLLAERCADDPLFVPSRSRAWLGLQVGARMLAQLKGDPK